MRYLGKYSDNQDHENPHHLCLCIVFGLTRSFNGQHNGIEKYGISTDFWEEETQGLSQEERLYVGFIQEKRLRLP